MAWTFSMHGDRNENKILFEKSQWKKLLERYRPRLEDAIKRKINLN